MNIKRLITLLAVTFAFALTLPACEDKAETDVEDGVEKIEEAADEVADESEGAVEEGAEAVEEAADKAE